MSSLTARIAGERLARQGILAPAGARPEDVVAWHGAVQAQEFLPACWGLALRLPETSTAADVGRMFDDGAILRTHVMRPTWHFVTPADIGWMIALTGAHVQRRMAPYDRQLELDTALKRKACRVFERALRDSRFRTRIELAEHLERAGIAARTNRLAHLALHAELEGLICSGPRRGNKFTYALLTERAPNRVALTRDEALAELTRRYFRSHGPATVRDFVWWSGLSTADARRGLAAVRATSETIDGLTYWVIDAVPGLTRTLKRVDLLPIYDEYIVAYRDRAAVPHGSPVHLPDGVTFQHALVVNGEVAGTWRVRRSTRGLDVEVVTARSLTTAEIARLRKAIGRYGRFVGAPVTLRLVH